MPRVLSLALGGLLAVLAACATKEYPAPALPGPQQAPALYAPQLDGEYRLQAGDTVAVRSYFDAQLNQEVLVRPDGRVTLLLVGEILAAGLTPEELADKVREPYRRLVGATDLTVAVVRSAGMNVYLSGEVRTPAIQPLDGSLTLLQAIARAGGTLASANTENVLLIRNRPDGALLVGKVDVEKILRSEAPDIYLQRRDVVYVPKSEIAQAGQFVDQYVNAIVPRFVQLQLNWVSSRVFNKNPAVEFTPQ
jgi:protein involved in polysaccharide export with SLBB domain